MPSYKTIVAQLHNNKVKEIIEAEARFPSLKTELESLEEQMRGDISIIERKTGKLQVHQIKKEIEEISNMRIKYHIDGGFLLHKYMEMEKNPHKACLGLDMLGKKNSTPTLVKIMLSTILFVPS